MTKKLRYKNDFVLYGEIVEQNDAGVWFKTSQKTSFISYDLIKCIDDVGD